MSTEFARADLLTPAESLERLKKICNQAVEIRVFFSQVLDLVDGVNDGGMVLSPKTAADLGKRCVRQRFTEVHRNLTRKRHRLRVVLRFQLRDFELVVIGYELLNRIDRHRLVILVDNVLQNFLRQLQRDFTPSQ